MFFLDLTSLLTFFLLILTTSSLSSGTEGQERGLQSVLHRLSLLLLPLREGLLTHFSLLQCGAPPTDCSSSSTGVPCEVISPGSKPTLVWAPLSMDPRSYLDSAPAQASDRITASFRHLPAPAQLLLQGVLGFFPSLYVIPKVLPPLLMGLALASGLSWSHLALVLSERREASSSFSQEQTL